MSNVGVMRSLAPKEGRSAGTAVGGCGEMVGKGGAFVDELTLDDGHMVCRIHQTVLVIRHDDNDVWLGQAKPGKQGQRHDCG